MLFLTKTKRANIKEKMLVFISEHEGEEFDFEGVSNTWKLSKKQVYSLLLELMDEKSIIAHQKHLRKPILISPSDYENFFWKVFIRSEKYPNSKLGQLGNLE
jgi:hypothetical protein